MLALVPADPVRATNRSPVHHLPQRLLLLSNLAVLLFLCLDHGALRLMSAAVTINQEK